MYLDSEFPGLHVLGFALFSFIHLLHSWVTMSSEATEGSCNCCFPVLLLKYTLYLQWYKQENPKKQSDQNPAGMVNGETAAPSVWRGQRSSGGNGEATDSASQGIRWAWVLLQSCRHWAFNAVWKKSLWVIHGSFLMLLAFVLALTELWGFSSWKSRV